MSTLVGSSFKPISPFQDQAVKQGIQRQLKPPESLFVEKDSPEGLEYKGMNIRKKFFGWISRLKIAKWLGEWTHNRFKKSDARYEEFEYKPNTTNYGMSKLSDDYSFHSDVYDLLKQCFSSENAYKNLKLTNKFIVKVFNEMTRIIKTHSYNKISHSKYGAMMACLKNGILSFAGGGNRDVFRQKYDQAHSFNCAEDSVTQAILRFGLGIPKILFLMRLPQDDRNFKPEQATPCSGCMRNFASEVYKNEGLMVIVSTRKQLESFNEKGLFLDKKGRDTGEQFTIYATSNRPDAKALTVIPWYRIPDLKIELSQGYSVRSKGGGAQQILVRAETVLHPDKQMQKLEEAQRKKIQATMQANFNNHWQKIQTYYANQGLNDSGFSRQELKAA